MGRYPQRQRVAAYAVVIRDEQILLSRLAPHIAGGELWALPGGGLDHGEDPGRAVVREIYEETGLHASVSREARVYSMHNPRAHHGDGGADYHALRIVFEGWVPVDSPEPRVIEVDGSTVAAGWHPLGRRALRQGPGHRSRPPGVARARALPDAATGGVRAGPPRGHRAAHPDLRSRPPARHLDAARWRHRPRREAGRRPAPRGPRGVRRRLRGRPAARRSTTCTSPAPRRRGRHEDYHGVHLVFAATVAPDAEPRVLEVGGTTDAVAWVPVADIEAGSVDVLDVVTHALTL